MDLAVEPHTGVGLADYSWLPADVQQAFQATLETDEGLAAVHFVGEVDRMTRRQYQRRVVIITADALYLCTPSADIVRCLLLDRVDAILVCDEWICLCVPSEYDVVFRLTANNSNRNCHQRFILDTIAALRHVSVGRAPPIHAVTSIHSLAGRQIERPNGQEEQPPVPIDVIKYNELGRLQNSSVLVRQLLPQHAALCDARGWQPSPTRRGEAVEVELRRPDTSQHQPTSAASPERFAPPRANVTNHVDVATSPLQPPGQKTTQLPMIDEATSPLSNGAGKSPRLSSPPAGKGRVSPPKFQAHPQPGGHASPTRFDPRVDLLWSEMKEQRAAIDEVRAQLQLLIAERFPMERRPGAAAVNAVSGHAATPRLPPYSPGDDRVQFAEDEARAGRAARGARGSPPRPDSPTQRPQPSTATEKAGLGTPDHHRAHSASKRVSGPSPRENHSSRLRREKVESAAFSSTTGATDLALPVSTSHSGERPSRKQRSDRPARRPPASIEAAVAGLGELSAFQRQLMADSLRDRPLSPTALRPPHRRATPENPHPPGTMFVRTKFDSPPPSPSRRTVDLNKFYNNVDTPHHRSTTAATRAHERSALRR